GGELGRVGGGGGPRALFCGGEKKEGGQGGPPHILRHEPKDIAALRADEIGGFLVGPVEPEERGCPGIEQRVALVKMSPAAHHADKLLAARNHFDRSVLLLNLLKVHKFSVTVSRYTSPMDSFDQIYEQFKVQGKELAGKIRELIHEGNVRRIIIKHEHGHTFMEIPLT